MTAAPVVRWEVTRIQEKHHGKHPRYVVHKGDNYVLAGYSSDREEWRRKWEAQQCADDLNKREVVAVRVEIREVANGE